MDGDAPGHADEERISVIITSLRKEYGIKLAEAFNTSVHDIVKTENSRVSIFNPSAEGEQQTGLLGHERKVIADMWLLSFADDIISTPRSTFGYIAHGLAGMKPVVFNRFGVDKERVPHPPCWRTNLPGPCYIDHPDNLQCPLDSPESYIAHTDILEVRGCELQWGIGVFEDDAKHIRPG
jgi:xyloglucan fucosyltransferase